MAEEEIKKALQKVKVSSKEAKRVEDSVKSVVVNSWSEKCEAMITKGVLMESIPGYLQHLKETYDGIDAKTLQKLEAIKYGKQYQNQLFDFVYNPKGVSKCCYGMIGFKKHDNEVDFMYCSYNILYDIPTHVYTQEKRKGSYLFGLITYDEIVDVRHDNSINTKNVNELKNFFRYKALKGFYQEGLIDHICDVPFDQVPTEDSVCKSL